MRKVLLLLAALCATSAYAVTTITTETGITGQVVVKLSIPTTETSPWVSVDAGSTVSIGPATTGTCKIQFTTSFQSEVTAGTAIAIDWAPGDVTSHASRLVEGRVSSVRGVSTSGICTMLVLK